jgi:CDP-paratose 2-epimerase
MLAAVFDVWVGSLRVGVALVTGSGGLIGSEAVRHFAGLGLDIVGIDNDMRQEFFGPEASTAWNVTRLQQELGDKYSHHGIDIRDRDGLARIFRRYGKDLAVVIHTAAQPSHDWAVRDPFTDFDINATGTLNILQNVRDHAIDTPVIHCSTNKVYGDRPNTLPYTELETRWELPEDHPYYQGITEDMSIDQCLHSVFGASKVAAFVMRCNMERRVYKIFGYQGKMVRDSIHSHDVLTAFEAFFHNPRSGAVYNLGGGRFSNSSHLEAFALAEKISGQEMRTEYVENNRVGDHKWWIGSNARFEADYPEWKQVYDVPMILQEIYEANVDKWVPLR